MKTLIWIVIFYIADLVCNIYWHKKIIDGKWLYTIYTTIITIIWTLLVLTI